MFWMNAALDTVPGTEATGRFLVVVLGLLRLSRMFACWIGVAVRGLRFVRPQDQSNYDRPDPS